MKYKLVNKQNNSNFRGFRDYEHVEVILTLKSEQIMSIKNLNINQEMVQIEN